jgi:hypothetical protein
VKRWCGMKRGAVDVGVSSGKQKSNKDSSQQAKGIFSLR